MSWGWWWTSCFVVDHLLGGDPDENRYGGGVDQVTVDDATTCETIMPVTVFDRFATTAATAHDMTIMTKDTNEKEEKKKSPKSFYCVYFVHDEKNGSYTFDNPDHKIIWTRAMSHLFSIPEEGLCTPANSINNNRVCFTSIGTLPLTNHLSMDGVVVDDESFQKTFGCPTRIIQSEITWMQRIPQQETWDCGVACLQMILQWIRKSKTQQNLDDDDDNQNRLVQNLQVGSSTEIEWLETSRRPSEEEMKNYLRQERENILRELKTQSIWTVDVVCLLHRLLLSFKQQQEEDDDDTEVNLLFCSTLLEINESYGNFSYYRNNFDKDHARIDHLFQILLEKQTLDTLPPVTLQTNKLPLRVLVQVVNKPQSIAMVLVDNAFLVNCCFPNNNNNSSHNQYYHDAASSSSSVQTASQCYAGHYILLVGTSTEPNHLRQSFSGSCRCRRDESNQLLNHHHQNHCQTMEAEAEQKLDDYCFVAYNPGNHPSIIDDDDEKGAMYISPQLLEKAWRAKGTDEDVIFVVAQKRRRM